MSVINQMLHDLECRNSQLNVKNVFLYSDSGVFPVLGNKMKIEIIFILTLVILITGFFVTRSLLSNNNELQQIELVLHDKNKVDFQHAVKIDEAPISETSINDSRSNNYYEITKNKAIDPIDLPVQQTNEAAKKIIKEKSIATKKIETIIVKDLKIDTPKKKEKLSTTIKPVKVSKEKDVVFKQQSKRSVKQQAEQAFQLGYQYLHNNNRIQAEEQLRNALMIMPDHIHSRELLAGIYIKNARFVEARTLLQYGMRISPQHTIFAKLSAQLLMNRGDNITAISVLQRNPPKQKDDPDYYALLAALYQKSDQHHKAATLYSGLLKIRKNKGVWWLGMAISLESLGKREEAKLAYQKATVSGTLSKGLLQYSQKRVNILNADALSSLNLD